MRRTVAAALLVATLSAASIASAARHDRGKHLATVCARGSSPSKSREQSYRRTLAADPLAQVYSLGGGPPAAPPYAEYKRHIYGCVYGHRGAYLLGTEPYVQLTKYMNESRFGDLDIVLAGPIVAYEEYSFNEGLDGARQGVVVKDLRTGRTLRDEPTGKARTPGGEPELEFGIGDTTAIVVKSDGSVAWIVGTSKANGGYQVHAADGAGSSVLASGPDIDPSSLALARSTVYWTQAGQAHSAPLD